MAKVRKIRPSDLPTRRVMAPDGSIILKKVVQAESPTLEADLLAAFRWNVRRILDEGGLTDVTIFASGAQKPNEVP